MLPLVPLLSKVKTQKVCRKVEWELEGEAELIKEDFNKYYLLIKYCVFKKQKESEREVEGSSGNWKEKRN